MQRYDVIDNGIANQDIKSLRESLGSICYTSRDFSSGEFDDMVKYVESKGIRIKDDRLVGEPLISSQKDTFEDGDFAKALFELKKNFCDERIEDVKIIGKKLYGLEEQPKKEEPVYCGTSPNRQSRQKNSVLLLAGLAALMIIVLVVLLLLKK